MIRKLTVFSAILGVLWYTAGCSSWLWMKKDEPGSVKQDSKTTGLVKPKIDYNAEATGPNRTGKSPESAEKKTSGRDSSYASSGDRSSTEVERSTARPDNGASRDNPQSSSARRSLEKGPDESSAVPRGRGPGSAFSQSGKDKDQDKGDSGPDTNKSDDNELFKKYDHSQYVKKIRSQAEKLVRNSPSCFYARLCRDFILDEWTLDTYRKSKKTYSYLTYFWDSIDQQWEKSSTSSEYPLSGLQHQLSFTSAGKECHVLKE